MPDIASSGAKDQQFKIHTHRHQ